MKKLMASMLPGFWRLSYFIKYKIFLKTHDPSNSVVAVHW